MEYPSLEYPLYILICFPNLLNVSVVKTLPLLNTFDGSEILHQGLEALQKKKVGDLSYGCFQK